ncbi:unnamed protein product [Timema podura]|uniref:Dynein heavy chain linker domain-containing protein n=1 Tax=Timema podura TaxID=61482 RepID=A0ABN7NHJ4_TIMPD|nr:unnamed protein product [Timema podura]
MIGADDDLAHYQQPSHHQPINLGANWPGPVPSLMVLTLTGLSSAPDLSSGGVQPNPHQVTHIMGFFFLSNDELLEILSETKDPQRVQPHLKKCFEGINTLEFSAEQEIVAMVSAEKEVVSFSGTIIPADAKGMVEKWLAQVEEQMVQSMKDTCVEAIQAYFSTAKNKWLLDWPGQIVICAECVHWTAEVAQAIEDSTLPSAQRLEKAEQLTLHRVLGEG